MAEKLAWERMVGEVDVGFTRAMACHGFLSERMVGEVDLVFTRAKMLERHVW